jgi:hypothetical protein
MEEKAVSIKMPKTTAQFCMRDLKGNIWITIGDNANNDAESIEP